jgi:hypothetical protein
MSIPTSYAQNKVINKTTYQDTPAGTYQNYLDLEEVGSSCRAQVESPYDGLVESVFPFSWSEGRSKIEDFESSLEDGASLEKLKQAVIQTSTNQVIHSWKKLEREILGHDLGAVVHLNAHRTDSIVVAMATSDRLLPKETASLQSALEINAELKTFNAIVQELNQTCAQSHQDFAQLKKILGSKILQDQELHPENASLIYPNGKLMIRDVASQVRARMKEVRAIGAQESNVRWNLLSNTRVGKLIQISSPLQSHVGHWHPLSCVEDGDQLQTLDSATLTKLMGSSLQSVREKYRTTLEELKRQRQQEAREVLTSYVTTAPYAISQTLLAQPSKQRAQQVCALIVEMKDSAELKEQVTAWAMPLMAVFTGGAAVLANGARGAMTFSTIAAGLNGLWLYSSVTDLYTSMRTEELLEQALVARQIDPAQGKMLVQNIRASYPMSIINLALAGVGTAAMSLKVSNIMRLNSYKRYLDVQGGATAKAWGKVKAPTQPVKTGGYSSHPTAQKMGVKFTQPNKPSGGELSAQQIDDLLNWVNRPQNTPQAPRPSGGSGGTAIATKPVVTTRPAIVRESSTPSIKTPQNGVLIQPSMKSAPFVGEPIKNKIYPMIPIIPLSPPSLEGQAEKSIQELFTFPLVQTSVVQVSPYDITNSPGDPVHFDDFHHLENLKYRMAEVKKILNNGAPFNPEYKWEICNLARTDSGYFGKAAREFLSKNPNIKCPDPTGVEQDLVRRAIGYRNDYLKISVSDSERKSFESALAVLFDGQNETIRDVSYIKKISKLNNDLGELARIWIETKFLGLQQSLKGKANEALIKNFGLLAFHEDERSGIREWIDHLYFNGSEREKSLASKWFLYHRIQAPKRRSYLDDLSELLELKRASKAQESLPDNQKNKPVHNPIVLKSPINKKPDKPKVTKIVPVVDSAENTAQNMERLNEALAEARKYSVEEARQYFEVELKKDNEKFIEFKQFKDAINFRAFSGNQDEIYLLLYYIHKKSTRNCNTGKCNVEDADLELIGTYLKNKQNIGETKARRWPLRLVDVGVLGQDPDNSEPAKSPENNLTSRGNEFLQPVFNYLPIETQPGQRFFRPGILLFDPSKGPINLGEPLNHDEQIIFDQIRLSGLMYEKINQLPNESEKASRVTKVWNAQNGDTYYLKSDFSGQDHDWYNRVTNIEYAVYLTNKKLINRYPSAILIELQGKRIFVIKKVSNDMKVNYREVNGRTHAELSAENLNKAVTQDLWTHPKISSELFIQLRDKGPFEIDLAEDIMLFDFLVANSDRAVDYNVSFPNHRKFNRIMSLDDLPIKLDDDYNGFLIYDGERSFEFDLSSRMDMEKEFQRYIRKYYYYSPEIKTAKDHILEVLRKNPEFIEKLKKWDAMMIRNELNHYLNHSEIERLINNRQTILELVEQIKVQPVEIENLGNSILNTEENKMFLILKNSNLSYNEIESLPVSKDQYRMNTRLWRDGHGSEYYFVIEDPREIEYGLNHRIDPKREYAAYYVDQKFFNRYPPAILIQVDGKPVFVFKKVKNQLQFNLSLEGNKYEGLSVVQLRDIVIPYIQKNYVQGDKLYEMMVRGSVVDFDLPDDILISDMLIGFSERNLYQNTFFVNCGPDKSQVDVNLNNLPYDISGLGCQIKVLDGRQAFVLKLDDRLGDQYKYWLANFLSRYSKSYHHHANAIRVVKDALQNNIERMRRISEWLPGEIKEELIPYISLSEINLLIQNRQRLLSLMAVENPSFRDPLEAQKTLTTREQVLAVVDDKNPFQFQDDLILEMNLILKEKSDLSNRLEKWIQDHSDPHGRFIFSLKEHVMIPFVLNPKSSALETVAEYTAIQWIARYAQNNDPAKRQAQDWIGQKKKNQIEVKNKLIEIIQGYQPGQPIIRTFDFENRKIQLTISDSMIQFTEFIGQLKFSFTVIIRDEINGKKILHNLELVKLNQNSMHHSIFSGDDLMDLSFQILSKIGVEVKTIESNWLPNPNQYLSRMYYAYVRGIEEGLIPTDAAKRTWISNQFLKHGYEVSHLNAPLDVVHSKEIVTVFYKKKIKALLSDPTFINLDNLPSTSQQDLVDQWNQGLVEPQLRDNIRAEIDPQFSTIRLFPAAGRLPKNAKARVFISHGLGVNTSSSKATAFMMEILGTLAKGKPRST